MQLNDENDQLEALGGLLGEMKDYLGKIGQGCCDLSGEFHLTDKAQALTALTQIMEGLNYFQKLLKSAAILLTIDITEAISEDHSITALFNDFNGIFSSIVEAAENEDYSLLADIVEYDLAPAINVSQGVLVAVQERYAERIR